jgi:hypothetical protein
MTTFWERVRKQSIAPISEWRETTMNRNPNGVVCLENRPAIYPFCGADIINLYTICPNASEYIMVALEKAGELPQPKDPELKILLLSLGVSPAIPKKAAACK